MSSKDNPYSEDVDNDSECISEDGSIKSECVDESISGGEELLYTKDIKDNIALQDSIDELKEELKQKDEDMLRKAADLDNYRKRLIKEGDDKIKYANQSVIESFIPVLDNLELTLSHITEDSAIKDGIALTLKSFQDILSKFGVSEIDSSVGIEFDPAIHDAMMMDNDLQFAHNIITLSIQKGYILNGRVVRAAKVKVNKL